MCEGRLSKKEARKVRTDTEPSDQIFLEGFSCWMKKEDESLLLGRMRCLEWSNCGHNLQFFGLALCASKLPLESKFTKLAFLQHLSIFQCFQGYPWFPSENLLLYKVSRIYTAMHWNGIDGTETAGWHETGANLYFYILYFLKENKNIFLFLRWYAYILVTCPNVKCSAIVYQEEQRAIKRDSKWWSNGIDVLGDTIWASSPSLVTTSCSTTR